MSLCNRSFQQTPHSVGLYDQVRKAGAAIRITELVKVQSIMEMHRVDPAKLRADGVRIYGTSRSYKNAMFISMP